MAASAFAAVTDRAENTSAADMPQGLWEAFSKAQHLIEPVTDPSVGARFAGQNPAGRMRFLFDEKGVTFKSGQSGFDWTLGMQLESYGTVTARQAYATQKLHLDGNTVTLDRGDIQEWYINRPEGLEQGFTLASVPQGHTPGQEIVLSLKLSGNLEARWQQEGQTVAFYANQTDYAFSYDKLLVVDATGKNLPAKMRLAQGQLQIQFDPTGAQWPVTVDPVVAVETKLVRSVIDAGSYDHFGISVALFGDTALIGVSDDDDGGSNSGTAYVFVRSGSSWSQQQKLTASNPAAYDYFGGSVALSGDTALIGSEQAACTAGGGCGAAYVFVRSGGTWTQQQILRAADAAVADTFGNSVALFMDTAVIGAVYDNDDGTHSGSAYVFIRTGSNWSQQQKLTAYDAAVEDHFGMHVTVSGDTAIIGAPWDDDYGTDSGSAYVYHRAGSTWSLEQKLFAADAAAYEEFSDSLTLSGDTAIIATPWHSNGGAVTGAAYVFTRGFSGWSQQQELTASDGVTWDKFGISVALSGNTALIGSHTTDCAAGTDCGAAYIFVRNGSNWSERRKLTASDAASGDYFGTSVALSADTALIGAHGVTCSAGTNCGAAYVYHFPCGYGSGVPANRWTMIGIPCDPGAANTVQDILGDQLNPSRYYSRWVVYRHDTATDGYNILDLASPMRQGEGYWLLSLDATVWDVNGTETPRNTSNPNCLTVDGCYVIDLTPPASGQPRRFNLIGHAFSFNVDWSDVRVEVNGTAYTPSAAKAAGYMEKEMWIYNGNGYDVFDDTTYGMDGTLVPQGGIFVAVLNGAAGKTIKLLIPVANTFGSPPPPPTSAPL